MQAGTFNPSGRTMRVSRNCCRVLKGAEDHGLNPEDYHYSTLAGWPESTDPMQLAARDVLATEALIRFGYHLHFGKIDAAGLDPDWNLTRRLQNEEPVTVLEQAVAAPELDTFLATRLEPDGTFYAGLRAALARYREIAAAGGWPTVPEGPTLRPGDRDPRVVGRTCATHRDRWGGGTGR